jgi:hypothetical protein
MVKRIIDELKISKIACVDRPAQQGALVRILKRRASQQLDDDDIDDWSDQGVDAENEDDDEEEQLKKQRKVEHPFMRQARRLAAAHGVPLYHGMSLARQQDPHSYRHYIREGVGMSRPKIRKSAPDTVAEAWSRAVNSWTDIGMSRCEAMTKARKRAPKLWEKFRR